MSEFIKLDFLDLAIAAGLMVIAIGLSIWQKIGLELNLATATVRTILQLVVLGYILDFILALNNLWAVLAILAVMLTLAAIIAKNRISHPQSSRVKSVNKYCLIIDTIFFGKLYLF